MNNVSMEKERINVAELLKDCPKGMELYSPLCGKCVFDRINMGTIICKKQNTQEIAFTSEGYYMLPVFDDCECMIFPSKDLRDWSKFQIPFKEGDVVVSNHGYIHLLRTKDSSYCAYRGDLLITFDPTITTNVHVSRHATAEEKAKLFQAIRDNGYRFNSKTKRFDKVIRLKFKVGDRIKSIIDQVVYTIIDIRNDTYILSGGMDKYSYHVPFRMEKNYELVCPKFNISSLKPFDRVLVRNSDNNTWCASIFSHTWEDTYLCAGILHTQCIPYEGNEHLLGTTNRCDEFFITWKK